MEHQRTLNFADLDDKGETLAIVRPVLGGVELALSKKLEEIRSLRPLDVAISLAEAIREAAR